MIHLNVSDLNDSGKGYICNSLKIKGFIFYTDYNTPRTFDEVKLISIDPLKKQYFLKRHSIVSLNEPMVYIKRR